MKMLSCLGLMVGLLMVVISPSPASAQACASQPTHTSGTSITNPAPGAVVTSPVMIAGIHTLTFEAVVPIRILDAAGNVLIDATTRVQRDSTAFETMVSFDVSAPTPACIVVYRENVAEGGLIPLVQIPVTLSPGAGLPPTGTERFILPLFGLGVALLGGGALVRRMILSQSLR